MPGKFEDDGIRFQFPENWIVEREDTADGWTVTVQSPYTAFFMLTVNSDSPATDQVLATALETLKAEYQDLEYEDCIDSIAGLPAVGHDIRFISLDLTNTCWTRAFDCAAGTVLILCQCNDLETDVNEPVLRAICKSLEVDD